MPLFAQAITAWMHGEQSHRARAAAINVASVIRLHAMSLTDNKWDR